MKMSRMERVKRNIKYVHIWESRECKSNGKCLSLFRRAMEIDGIEGYYSSNDDYTLLMKG